MSCRIKKNAASLHRKNESGDASPFMEICTQTFGWTINDLERCRSGRSGRTRNAVNGQLFPGFESLSFREAQEACLDEASRPGAPLAFCRRPAAQGCGAGGGGILLPVGLSGALEAHLCPPGSAGLLPDGQACAGAGADLCPAGGIPGHQRWRRGWFFRVI